MRRKQNAVKVRFVFFFPNFFLSFKICGLISKVNLADVLHAHLAFVIDKVFGVEEG